MHASNTIIPADCQQSLTWWGLTPYRTALSRMEEAHETALRKKASQAGEISPRFFYLEHPAVITYGRATPENELELGAPDIPRISVPRGGLATYHAPGQLVGYIVMDLSQRRGRPADIHAYLRAIEQGIIDFIVAEFKLPATRREGFTGVWTPPDETAPHGRKLASIGVSARKWITSHGFALNIHPDMRGFDAIVPCGITDAPMTSLEREAVRNGNSYSPNTMEHWASVAHSHLFKALQGEGWLL